MSYASRSYRGPFIPPPPGLPVTYAQAVLIGRSIGGVDSYCPGLKNIYIKGGTHVHALTKLGVDKRCAARAIDRMIKEGAIFQFSDKDLSQAERDAKVDLARKILEEECSVSCPAAASFTYP